MGLVFWVLQGLLALLCIPGGAFKIVKFEDLKKGVTAMRSTPKSLWVVFGAFEVVTGILLLVPATTVYAAAAVAIESIAVSVLYTKYGDRSPRTFTIAMAVLAIVIAYGRFALAPY